MRVIIVQQRQRRNCALEIERFEQLKVRICEAVSCNASRTHARTHAHTHARTHARARLALDCRLYSYPICSQVPQVQSRL